PGIANKTDLERELVNFWNRKGSRWTRFVAHSPLPKLDKIFDLTKLPTNNPKVIDFAGEKVGLTQVEALNPVTDPMLAQYVPDENDAMNVTWLEGQGVKVDKTYYKGSKQKLIVALELLEMTPDSSAGKWNLLADLDFAQRLWMT